MERDLAEQRGLTPLGRLVAYSYAGVDPKFMGIGPVPAVRSLLGKTGLTLDEIDVIELNEAFAAQALSVCHELDPTSRASRRAAHHPDLLVRVTDSSIPICICTLMVTVSPTASRSVSVTVRNPSRAKVTV